MAAYRNAGWMSPELANIIDRVVNNCKVCKKFQMSVARLRVTLPKTTSFNEVITLDFKEFSYNESRETINHPKNILNPKLLQI